MQELVISFGHYSLGLSLMVKRAVPEEHLKSLLDRWKESTTARNISKVYFGDLTSKILNLGAVLLLIRGMQKVDYASFVAFTSIATVSASLIGSGINNALVRFSAEHLSRTGDRPFGLYLLSLLLQLSAFVIVLLSILGFPAEVADMFLGKPELAGLVSVATFLGLGHLLLEFGRSILQTEERFNHYVGTLWLQNGLIFLSIVTLWVFQRLHFSLVAWSLVIIHLLVGVAVVWYGLRDVLATDWRSRLRNEKYLVRDFLSASGWLIAYYLVLAGFSRMDVVMLSRFASEEELANYGVALKYYSMALLMLGSIRAVLAPRFSRVEMHDQSRQSHFIGQWLKKSVWLGIPAVLFVAFGKPVFVFVNGIQYERSFAILRVLTIGVWLSLMLSPLVNVLMSRKEFRFLFSLSLVAFVVSLVSSAIGVQMGGGVGAAISVVLTHNIVLQIPILRRVKQ